LNYNKTSKDHEVLYPAYNVPDVGLSKQS